MFKILNRVSNVNGVERTNVELISIWNGGTNEQNKYNSMHANVKICQIQNVRNCIYLNWMLFNIQSENSNEIFFPNLKVHESLHNLVILRKRKLQRLQIPKQFAERPPTSQRHVDDVHVHDCSNIVGRLSEFLCKI